MSGQLACRVVRVWALIGVVCLTAVAARAEDPTVELLTAPYVRSYVRIVPDKDAPRVALDGIDFAYAEPLTFLASGRVKFVIGNYNPLTMEVKVDAVESDDPSHAALDKFVSAFLKTFKPTSTEMAASAELEDRARAVKEAEVQTVCSKLSDALDLLVKFDLTIRGVVGADADGVKLAAEAAIGREGMRKQAKTFGDMGQNASDAAESAKSILRQLEALRDGIPKSSGSADYDKAATALEEAEKAVRTAEAAYLAKSRDEDGPEVRKEREEARKKWRSAQDALANARKEVATLAVPKECAREALGLLAIFFRTQPAEQVDRISRFAKAAKDLAVSLGKTADNSELWYPPAYGPFGDASANASSKDFVVDSKGPKPASIVTVTVNAKRTVLSVSDGNIQQVFVPKSESKTVYRIRNYSTFAPELGVGLVLASVKTPTYGVVKDASGATVVAKTKIQDREFKGALMLNAVCRCWGNSFLYPMLQFGIAPDNDAPAIFSGLGFRFTRPKGLGIAAGGVLAWVKDLDKLRIGGPVASQAEIDADLKAQPTVKAYFTVQYSF